MERGQLGAEAFTEDLVELAQAEGVIPRPERSDSSPSPGVAAGLVAMLGAALPRAAPFMGEACRATQRGSHSQVVRRP